MKNTDGKKLIVFTGGHHSSALPVVERLIGDYPEYAILWLGHKHSLKNDKNPTLEYKEITALNIPFINLKAGKFYKTFDPVRIAKIPFGFFQALGILVKYKPSAIMSFGGYLAVPVVLTGKLLGIPVVTHEQTITLGYANLLISKFADKILVSWPQSQAQLPKSKTIYTGIPLRSAVFEVRSNHFDVQNGLPTIYVTAGKTGSHKINTLVKEALPELLKLCNVIHQSGDYSEFTDYEDMLGAYATYKEKMPGKLFLRKYVLEDEIGEAFNKASLIISRAGAHTCAEIIASGKPSVLIPIPWVSHNEQMLNALLVKDAGLAEVLPEKELTSKMLIEAVTKVLNNLSNYKLNNTVHLNAHPEELIIKELINVLKKN